MTELDNKISTSYTLSNQSLDGISSTEQVQTTTSNKEINQKIGCFFIFFIGFIILGFTIYFIIQFLTFVTQDNNNSKSNTPTEQIQTKSDLSSQKEQPKTTSDDHSKREEATTKAPETKNSQEEQKNSPIPLTQNDVYQQIQRVMKQLGYTYQSGQFEKSKAPFINARFKVDGPEGSIPSGIFVAIVGKQFIEFEFRLLAENKIPEDKRPEAAILIAKLNSKFPSDCLIFGRLNFGLEDGKVSYFKSLRFDILTSLEDKALEQNINWAIGCMNTLNKQKIPEWLQLAELMDNRQENKK